MISTTNQTNKKQPQGLFYLFFAELWERFSFYGMRALLTLYMTEYLMYSDEQSFGVFAAYGSLVYVTSILGGMLADKVLGYRKAIILGGILMAIGHFVLAIDNDTAFYLAMGFIIMGNGFFKPNISSMVGSLYDEDDIRRESGFTLFYMGINLGGMAAPLFCGWIGNAYGWHYGFGLAGIGMIIGLLVFYRGMKKKVFQGQGYVPSTVRNSSKIFGLTQGGWIALISMLMVPVFAWIVKYNQYEHYLVAVISIGLSIVLAIIFFQSSRIERGRLLVVVYFTGLATIFWSVFEQGGSSLTLFAKRNVDLVLLNASQTNSINSFFIIVLAIFFSWMWSYLSQINRNPNSPLKFGIGLVVLGMGFLVFGYSGQWSTTEALTPMVFLVFGYFLYTLGEMFISPIGLSKVTELAPLKYASFLMGVWFLSSFYGHYFAGKIAKMTTGSGNDSLLTQDGWVQHTVHLITGITPESIIGKSESWTQLYAYVTVFSLLGIIVVSIGFAAIIISPMIRKLMAGVH